MRIWNFSILFVIVLSVIVLCCETDNDKNTQLIVTGKLVSHTSCVRGLKLIKEFTVISDSLSCINFSYDDLTKKMAVKHLNAGFNCCPDSLYCNIRLSNDTIIVQEFEKNNYCKCDCLYDLDIEISGVDAKKYQLRLIEPYSGSEDKINFRLDLAKDKNGTFCVTRRHYPWGV